METNKPRKNESTTTTTEYGYYIRKKIRHGKRRKQKTTRIKNNPEKIILGKLGDLEIYAYPYQYPNKIFVGIYPLSTYIEEHQKEDILVLYNRVRWYFNEEWTKKRKQGKWAKTSRKAIVSAYNHALNNQRSKE